MQVFQLCTLFGRVAWLFLALFVVVSHCCASFPFWCFPHGTCETVLPKGSIHKMDSVGLEPTPW